MRLGNNYPFAFGPLEVLEKKVLGGTAFYNLILVYVVMYCFSSRYEFKLKLKHFHTSRWTHPRHSLSIAIFWSETLSAYQHRICKLDFCSCKCKCNFFTHGAPTSSQELVQKCPCIPGSNWNLKMLNSGLPRTNPDRSRVEDLN